MGDFPGHPFRGNQYTHEGLVSHLTQEDAKRSARARARGHYDNPHAIALELQAADRVKARVAKGEHPRDAFSDEFNPTASNYRYAKKAALGLDVERGQWVKPSPLNYEDAKLFASGRSASGQAQQVFGHPVAGPTVSRGDYKAAKRAPRGTQRVTALLKIADKLAKQNPGSLLAQTRKRGHGAQ